eukprot:Skav226569  [mRNA]  locus=scaffold1701:102785:110827:- [translate_table: standard]
MRATSAENLGDLARAATAGLDILQQKTELKTPHGHVEVVALRPSDEKLQTVLVNVGDGRVGCHGYSLLGNTSYATLAASHAADAPATRPLVRCIVPAISFSRIQPTVFVRGQSLAAELALRFLWLAEVGSPAEVIVESPSYLRLPLRSQAVTTG